MWVWVARWVKNDKNIEEIRAAASHVAKHWREVALDQGLDPDKNVVQAESERLVSVGISEEMDMEFREEPGEWRFY